MPKVLIDYQEYAQRHMYIKTLLLKPTSCQLCKKETDKLELANKNHKYSLDLEDWEWLCRRCHMLKDGRLRRFLDLRIRRYKERYTKRTESNKTFGIKCPYCHSYNYSKFRVRYGNQQYNCLDCKRAFIIPKNLRYCLRLKKEDRINMYKQLDIKCKWCGSYDIIKHRIRLGNRQFVCKSCKREFTIKSKE